jgi:hypothetical protein
MYEKLICTVMRPLLMGAYGKNMHLFGTALGLRALRLGLKIGG